MLLNECIAEIICKSDVISELYTFLFSFQLINKADGVNLC